MDYHLPIVIIDILYCANIAASAVLSEAHVITVTTPLIVRQLHYPCHNLDFDRSH